MTVRTCLGVDGATVVGIVRVELHLQARQDFVVKVNVLKNFALLGKCTANALVRTVM